MTFDKLRQKYLSVILSIITAIINYRYYFSLNIDMSIFTDKAIDFSSISFGFLLAVLALLIQSDTPALNIIKINGRFNELISLNKKAVIASAFLVVVALIYVSFKIDVSFKDYCLYHNFHLKKIADSLVLAIFIYQATEVYYFLDLFYIIIKS